MIEMKYSFIFLLIIYETTVLASPAVHIARVRPQEARITPSPIPSSSNNSSYGSLAELKRRGVLITSTCGYLNGDPALSRTAGPDNDCTVDSVNNIWGFCPTTVVAATYCGLAGNCYDSHSCSGICGVGTPGLTTFSCTDSSQPYCSTALLIQGPGKTYPYIACGPTGGTVTLFATPTPKFTEASVTKDPIKSTPTTTSQPSSSSPSPSSADKSTVSPQTSSQPISQESPESSSQTSSLTLPNTLPTSTSAPSTSETSSPITKSDSDTSNPSSKSNVGAIVGGVIGGFAVLSIALLVFGMLFLRVYRQKNLNLNNQVFNSNASIASSDSVISMDDLTVMGIPELEAKRASDRSRRYEHYVMGELPGTRDPAELGG